MIFDKLCHFAEVHNQKLVALVNRTRLFVFDATPSPLFSSEQERGLLENFYLPFDNIAVDDGDACLLIHDTKPEQLGIQTPRNFIDVRPLVKPHEPVSGVIEEDRDEAESICRSIDPEGAIYVLSFGCLEPVRPDADDDRLVLDGTVQFQFVWDDKSDELKRIPITEESRIGAVTAVRKMCVKFADTYVRHRFILERSPIKPRESKPDRALRSHDRAQHMILGPEEIRILMEIPLNQVIIIETEIGSGVERSVWHGPTEKVIGTKKYKVITER
jgi:hypothetical protein